MKFAPAVMVAVMILGALAVPAFAQTGPSISGGNITCTLPSGSDDGAGSVTVSSADWTSFDYHTLFLASMHGWMSGASVQTPALGLLSARAVRFASAGRPGARVNRVTTR